MNHNHDHDIPLPPPQPAKTFTINVTTAAGECEYGDVVAYETLAGAFYMSFADRSGLIFPHHAYLEIEIIPDKP